MSRCVTNDHEAFSSHLAVGAMMHWGSEMIDSPVSPVPFIRHLFKQRVPRVRLLVSICHINLLPKYIPYMYIWYNIYTYMYVMLHEICLQYILHTCYTWHFLHVFFEKNPEARRSRSCDSRTHWRWQNVFDERTTGERGELASTRIFEI